MVSNRRTKVKTRTKYAKRMTRKRKGGEECRDITTHKDNYHCVQAGCNPVMCAEYYIASKPHKPVVDNMSEIAEQMKRLEQRATARTRRIALRKALRTASRTASRTTSQKPALNLVPALTDAEMSYWMTNWRSLEHDE